MNNSGINVSIGAQSKMQVGSVAGAIAFARMHFADLFSPWTIERNPRAQCAFVTGSAYEVEGDEMVSVEGSVHPINIISAAGSSINLCIARIDVNFSIV